MNPSVSLALRCRADRPVPPGQLAAELRLSTRQLAQAVQELSHLGFAIESHPMLGLRLTAPPPDLQAEEIGWNLNAQRVGRRVRCVGTAGSTNSLAWEAATGAPDEADGLAVFAEYQTAGRGRRGSRWLSPPHASILCSVVLRVPQAASGGGVLTRAAAVAAAEAIEQHCDLDVGIRWPNDLVIDDRKVGGILVEARAGGAETAAVVLGIGINCTQREQAFPPDIRRHVTSLVMTGRQVDRTLLARSLLERLDRTCAAGTETRDALAEVARQARRRCRTLGCRIAIVEEETTYSGEVVDLDPDYGLVLRLAGGGLRQFRVMTAHVLGPGGAGQAGEKPA